MRVRHWALVLLVVGVVLAGGGAFAALWAAVFGFAMMDADRAARAGEFAVIGAAWDLGRAALVLGAIIVVVTAATALSATLVMRRRLPG